MAKTFNIPSSPKVYTYVIDNFLGADFTSDASTVDETKSPNCENMIRSVPGKVRKRTGYELLSDFGAYIYGVHEFHVADERLIHAGTNLYKSTDAENPIYTGMAEHRSVAFELNMKLFILDGASIKVYDGNTVSRIDEVGFIPTVTISKNPEGGGKDYQPLNLVQPAFIEQFYVDSNHTSTKDFQLTFGGLDSTPVLAWVLNGNGDWTAKTEGTDFSVNRTTGKITFVSAPGQSPVTGEDNVKIQAYRTVPGYADRINHCTIGALFGVNGADDRLFVSGNSDKGLQDGKYYSYINYDWFSQQYDPTYFGDTWYSKLGSDSSAIMGYSIINNYLAAHKDANELSQSVLIREGNLSNGEPSFKLINTLQGAGAISKYCFSYLETEPVFLSKLGVYAITAQDVTGEKYAQDRSYYLEGKLLNEPNIENAFAFSYKDYYILCVNSHCYILDGLQPMQTDRARPYATRQYAGFYWTNIPATCMFEDNGRLCFGSSDGKIYGFYTDIEAPASYNDNGTAISCVWETADISEKLFYKNKTYRYVALRIMPEIVSSVKIWAQKQGIWQLLKEDAATLRYFSFANLTFSKMSFRTDKTQKVTATKARIKKVDHVRFRFTNDENNEPLGINDFAVEYTQNGNKK